MRTFGRILVTGLLAAFAVVGSAATSGVQRFTSSTDAVALVELFTSEGCSSCPPADRWFSNLQNHPGLWTEFVPLAFHVDYWDYIGWRDRFASSRFSDRQRRYAREGSANTVYTPGLFRAGREWRGWYRGESPVGNSSAMPGALTVEIAGDRVIVNYASDNAQELIVNVARLGMGLTTDVRAGENDGATLSHDFVVLGLTSSPLARSEGTHTAVLELPDVSSAAEQQAIAAWVSTKGRQAPLQAVGGYFEQAFAD